MKAVGLRARKTFDDITVFGQIEIGVSADSGGDTIASRDTFVGIEGGFGKLRFGKMDTPFKQMGGLTERFKGTGIQDDGSLSALGVRVMRFRAAKTTPSATTRPRSARSLVKLNTAWKPKTPARPLSARSSPWAWN